MSIAYHSDGLYAVGCRSYTILLDARTLQTIKKITSRYSGCGIRATSFEGNLLTVGTGLGMLLFYDIRAGKYLESSVNASRTVALKCSKGIVVSEDVTVWFSYQRYRPFLKEYPFTLLFCVCCSTQRMRWMAFSR